MAKTNIDHYAKVIKYPDGLCDIIASTSPDFRPKGWENANDWGDLPLFGGESVKAVKPKKGEGIGDPVRAMRRARAQVRRLALCNDFRWFITLTLDQSKVDRYDPAAVVKKLNAWCSNMVHRHNLRYILVPERHKDGAIHFHGFFSDSVRVVYSGHKDSAGHAIYNLPQWKLGFTTAIELYDDYHKAVGYVCKYIGKQGEKPAGRWYYSGGDLNTPTVEYTDISPRELMEAYGDKVYNIPLPGRLIAVINNVRDQVLKEEEMITAIYDEEGRLIEEKWDPFGLDDDDEEDEDDEEEEE